MKKKEISTIYLSCYGNKYSVTVLRGNQTVKSKEKKDYDLKSSSIVFRYLSNMMNFGKLDTHVHLPVYPTYILTVNKEK